MARVRGERDADRRARGGGELAGRADVVLHVARALRHVRVELAFELAEDLRVRLADDVGEHVEAAAVRHAHHDLLHAGVGRAVDQEVEHRDQRLGAFEAEALLAEELRVQEALERLGAVQRRRGCDACRRVDVSPCTPSTFCWIQAFWSGSWMCMYSTPIVRAYASRSTPRMSRSFMASRPASPPVGNSRSRSQIVRPQWFGSSSAWVCGSLQAERIEVRDEVPAHAVHVDELLHRDDLVLRLDRAFERAVVGRPARGS